MRADDRAGDRQPDPQATRLRRRKCLKQIRLHCRGDARPRIRDGDGEVALVNQATAQREDAPRRLGHRFERVPHQVEKDLLNLNPVAPEHPHIVIDVENQRGAGVADCEGGQLDDVQQRRAGIRIFLDLGQPRDEAV